MPYEQNRKHSKFDFAENLQVVPVEIEIDSLVYSLIKHKILENMEDDGVSFEEWVDAVTIEGGYSAWKDEEKKKENSRSNSK